MKGFHDIHCPFCGCVTSPVDIKFSISEFVDEIYRRQLDEKYNDGILGIIDTDYITLIIDNDFLWDMSVIDISKCRDAEQMFVLAGENLVKRFGDKAVSLLNDIPLKDIELVANSNNMPNAIKATPQVKELLEEILKNISDEKLLRAEIDAENRDAAVVALIHYAKTNNILFKIGLEVEIDRDDMGQQIYKDIRTKNGNVICKSKKCNNCGNSLSKLAGKYEEKIISFIGSPAAGKTAYLAAVINKLKNDGLAYGIEPVFDFDSADYLDFNEACLEHYSKGFAVTKTNADTFPQISVAIRNANTKKAYLYTFVDIPGETFIDGNGCNEGDLNENRKIIKYADVVWYCVSAKQLFSTKIGRVRRARSEGMIVNEEINDLLLLGNNTINFTGAMFKDGEKKPAVALVLTKSDLLSKYIKKNVFAGDFEGNIKAKKKFFKTICAATSVFDESSNDYNEDEDFEYCDGEPKSLEYMEGNKLIYTRLLKGTKDIKEFIIKQGEPSANAFIGNVMTAFDKSDCPCFSQASYGRNPVEKFSLDTAVRFLLEKKAYLSDEYEDLQDIFGAEELEAFEKGESKKLKPVSNMDDVNFIKNLYQRLNPARPFGIMTIMEWTLAYTGLVECVQYDDGEWKTVPTSGESFEELRSKLRLESEGNVTIYDEFNPKPNPKPTPDPWWRRFGR